jgi:hypothetical protein
VVGRKRQKITRKREPVAEASVPPIKPELQQTTTPASSAGVDPILCTAFVPVSDVERTFYF